MSLEDSKVLQNIRRLAFEVQAFIVSLIDRISRSKLRYSSSASQHNIAAAPTGKQAAGKADEPSTSETVVLLADADLLELPLEAVASLRAEVIDSVSRDISLQLLYHRLTTTPSGE